MPPRLSRVFPAACIMTVLALTTVSRADPLTSGPLWTFQTQNSQPAQFGMVDGDQLYCSSYDGHVYQLDLATGRSRTTGASRPARIAATARR